MAGFWVRALGIGSLPSPLVLESVALLYSGVYSCCVSNLVKETAEGKSWLEAGGEGWRLGERTGGPGGRDRSGLEAAKAAASQGCLFRCGRHGVGRALVKYVLAL